MADDNAIGLNELIRKVKEELLAAHDPESPLFAIGPVELEITFTVERSMDGGVEFWVVKAGAEGKLENVQRVKLTLTPLVSAQEVADRMTDLEKNKAAAKLMRGADHID